MSRFLVVIVLALGLAAPAVAEDFTRYALSVATIQKVQSASKEIEKKVGKKYEDNKADENMDAARFAKFVDSVPEAKPILAKHGLSSKEFAHASFAMMEAGLFVMLTMDPKADQKEAAKLMATYPAETRANIELLRRNPQLLK
ncbi:hypothetical protein H8N03_18300 [Ramlibacter sp. USB13]|uniref:DUF4142 domain-containing protein n=1 Tax=Ramlibacter cellulosilyticus TaxID=2764187 RepID=A0A923MUJ5_9BURK|nr:hypothetical protein [Ramlibacter cellulosilyticus]MBC5784904.1 hypothetical protein [Ramlibacter cellulosilyticus]